MNQNKGGNVDINKTFYEEQIKTLKELLENWKIKYMKLESEKVIQQPAIEVVKYVDRPVDKIVQKIVEIPIEVVKYVDRTVEKIVENKVEVPVIKYVERIVEKLVEKKVDVPVEIVKVIENRVEVPIEVVKYVDKIVERPVEVIREVVKYVDRIVEKKVEVPVEIIKEKIVVDDRRVKELENQLIMLVEENKRLMIIMESSRIKMIKMGSQIVNLEYENRTLANDKVYLEGEIVELKKETYNWRVKYSSLMALGPNIVERLVDRPIEVVKFVDRPVERIVERKIEIPVEIVKYKDNIVEKPIEIIKEKVVVDEWRIQKIEGYLTMVIEENKKLQVTLEDWRTKVIQLENEKADLKMKYMTLVNEGRSSKVSEKTLEEEKTVEKPMEKTMEVPMFVEKRFEIERQIEILTEENCKMKMNLQDWRGAFPSFERDSRELQYLRTELEKLRSQVENKEDSGNEIHDMKVNELTRVIADYELRMKKYEQTISEMIMEIAYLDEIKGRVEGLKKAGFQKEDENILLREEIRSLNSVIANLRKELEDWREKYCKLEISFQEKRNSDYEMTEIKKILMLKEKEIDEWKKKFIEVSNPLSNNKKKEEKLGQKEERYGQIEISFSERGKLHKEGQQINYENKGKLEISMQQSRDDDQKLFVFNNEIDRLANVAKKEVEDVEKWTQQFMNSKKF